MRATSPITGVYSGLPALGTNVYLGIPALGTKVYPGLAAPVAKAYTFRCALIMDGWRQEKFFKVANKFILMDRNIKSIKKTFNVLSGLRFNSQRF